MWGKACLIRICLCWLFILRLSLLRLRRVMSCSHLIRWFMGLSSFVLRCLLQLRSWLKPNFSAHWGNWLLAPLVAFFLGFLPVSAFASDYYYKTQSYNGTGSTYTEACENAADNFKALIAPTSSCGGVEPDAWYSSWTDFGNGNGRCGITYETPICYGSTFDRMSTSYSSDNAVRYGCSEEDKNNPASPCYEHQCPAPGTLYSGELIGGSVGSGFTDPDGCPLLPNWVPVDCDDPSAPPKSCDRVDGYVYADPSSPPPPPPPPKNCKDSTGRYIGQVSGNASCPDVQKTKCYNPDGTLAYTADSPAQCPSNTSPENKPDITETDSDIDPETGEPTGEKTTEKTESTSTSTETVINPDGSVTTTTTTTTTRSDGSTSTTTSTKTEYSDGTITEATETEETEVEDASTVSGGESCNVEPSCDGDPLQCYQIKQQWRDACHKNEFIQGTNCGDKFVCQGSPIDCFRMRLERDQYCSVAETAASFEPGKFQSDFESSVGITESEMVNEDGEIRGLWQSVDLADSGLGDIDLSGNGSSGSCPAPIPMPFGAELSFEPMCEVAGMIRYLVIGGTALYCLFIINSGVLQGRRKS